MKSILVVEDNVIQSNALKKILSTHRTDIQIYQATDYHSAISCMEQQDLDMFMLDIALDVYHEEKDGIDLGNYIRTIPKYKHTPIIYITSIMDKAIEALNTTHCYAYITKPYTPTEVIETIDSLLSLKDSSVKYLNIKGLHNIYYQVMPDDIIYIVSYNHLITIVTKDSTYETRSHTLSELLSMLPDDFVQCHKGYIINRQFIELYNKTEKTIQLKYIDTSIPVGRKFKDILEEK